MESNKVKGFFYLGNAVSGEPYYGLAEFFVRSAEASANATYQSIYVHSGDAWNMSDKFSEKNQILCYRLKYLYINESLI